MREQTASLDTRDGTMEVFVAQAETPAPVGVILCMDVWGVREELRDIVRHVARLGYDCILPDFFYREGRVRHDFRDASGRAVTLASLTPEQQEAVRGPMRRLSDDMALADFAALFDAQLLRQQSYAPIGYCMGGRHALIAAGAFPGQVVAAASLHGSFLVQPGADSAHTRAARTNGEIYCGFAERDPFAAPDVIEALRAAFAEKRIPFRYNIHKDAEHGYALPERDIHDARATAQDWAEIEAMLARACAALTR